MNDRSEAVSVFGSQRALKIFGIAAFSAAAVCAALSIISRLFFFDAAIGYFEADAPVPVSYMALAGICALLAAVFCFAPRIRLSPAAQKNPLPVRIGAFFVALALLYGVANSVQTLFYVISDSYVIWDFTTALTLIAPIMFPSVACVYFFCLGAFGSTGHTFATVGVTFMIFHLALAIMDTYFNVEIAMNSPIKILLHVALISFILLLICEIRALLGGARPSLHLFSATVSTLFCAAFSLPELFMLPSILTRSYLTRAELVLSGYALLMLAAFVFSATRLACICFMRTPDGQGDAEQSSTPEADDTLEYIDDNGNSKSEPITENTSETDQ